jgi:hypothetical protein
VNCGRRFAKVPERGVHAENYIRAGRVNSRITISTAADQMPIVPGKTIADAVKDGR